MKYADQLVMRTDLKAEKSIAKECAYSARWRALDPPDAILPIAKLSEFGSDDVSCRGIAYDGRRAVFARR